MRLKSSWLIMLVLMMTATVAAAAQEDQSTPGTGVNKIVNLDLKDTPIKDAIDSIFQGSGLRYYVSPNVSGRVVELKLAGVTVEEAINALVEAAGLTLKVQDGTYIIANPTRVTVSRSRSRSSPSQPPASAQQTPTDQTGSVSSESSAQMPQQSEQSGQPEQPTVSPPGDVQAQSSSPANVAITQPPASYYGMPGGAYSDPFAYNPYYNPSAFRPVYQFGRVQFLGSYPTIVITGPNTYILQRGPLVPPPPGYVGPDTLRFLRNQWAIQNRTYLTFPYYPYPY